MAGFVEVEPGGRVVHHQIDQVGHDLTRRLMWCSTHTEPVWRYGDGSFTCPWEYVTGHLQHLEGCGPGDHQITTPPWETT